MVSKNPKFSFRVATNAWKQELSFTKKVNSREKDKKKEKENKGKGYYYKVRLEFTRPDAVIRSSFLQL